MKTEAHFMPPSLHLFLRCFLLFFPVFYLLQLFFSFVFGEPVIIFSLVIFYRSLLFTLAVSLIPMLASRKMKLVVSFLHNNKAPLQNWLVNYFDQRGWLVKNSNEISVEFISKNKVNQLLSLDKTSVLFENHEIIITGPYRVVDDVYSRLKFGHHDFE